MNPKEVFKQLRHALGRVTLGPALDAFGMALEVRTPTAMNAPTLRCTIRVPDRNTGNVVKVHHEEAVPYLMNDDHALDIIYNTIQMMLRHELDEAWIVDGKRVNDPHA